MMQFWASAILVRNLAHMLMEKPCASTKLSSYGDKLPAEAKAHYLDKLALIGGVDPFNISGNNGESCSLPPVDASNIVSSNLCSRLALSQTHGEAV